MVERFFSRSLNHEVSPSLWLDLLTQNVREAGRIVNVSVVVTRMEPRSRTPPGWNTLSRVFCHRLCKRSFQPPLQLRGWWIYSHGGRVRLAIGWAGAPGSAIMHEGRWSSSALVAKYTPRGGGRRRPCSCNERLPVQSTFASVRGADWPGLTPPELKGVLAPLRPGSAMARHPVGGGRYGAYRGRGDAHPVVPGEFNSAMGRVRRVLTGRTPNHPSLKRPHSTGVANRLVCT